jgi:hypothetical protein
MLNRLANLFRPHPAVAALASLESNIGILETAMDRLAINLAKVKRREWADEPVTAHTLATLGRRTPRECLADMPALAAAKAESARRWAILRAEGFALNSYGGVL